MRPKSLDCASAHSRTHPETPPLNLWGAISLVEAQASQVRNTYLEPLDTCFRGRLLNQLNLLRRNDTNWSLHNS